MLRFKWDPDVPPYSPVEDRVLRGLSPPGLVGLTPWAAPENHPWALSNKEGCILPLCTLVSGYYRRQPIYTIPRHAQVGTPPTHRAPPCATPTPEDERQGGRGSWLEASSHRRTGGSPGISLRRASAGRRPYGMCVHRGLASPCRPDPSGLRRRTPPSRRPARFGSPRGPPISRFMSSSPDPESTGIFP